MSPELLSAFRHYVVNLWRRTLKRRGQKDHTTRQRIGAIAAHWLTQPHIQHPWPNQRFAVKYPRWEPYAGKSHVRFCAGGRSVIAVPTAIRNFVPGIFRHGALAPVFSQVA
jgi:hypothetical protein